MSAHIKSWLALGDSYTIGEGVALHEGYPYQAIQRLRMEGHKWHAPEVVARTAWTSFELADHLIHHHYADAYDVVTIAIGVNNQYRGLEVGEYENDLRFLVRKALHFCHDQPARIGVISIPNWSLTPFADGQDRELITAALNQFNAAAKDIAGQMQASFLDLRPLSDLASWSDGDLAQDQLHYGPSVYTRWAEALLPFLQGQG